MTAKLPPFQYKLTLTFLLKAASEYGQEMPHSHTADQPIASRGNDSENSQSHYINKLRKATKILSTTPDPGYHMEK